MEKPEKNTPVVRLTKPQTAAIKQLAEEERRTISNMTHILLEDALNARGIFLKPKGGWGSDVFQEKKR